MIDMQTLTFHDRKARWISGTLYVACVIASALIIALLSFIVGYIVTKGGHALLASFGKIFTEEPISRGSAGYPGGLHNAIIGTLELIAIAGAVGIPIGILAGVYLAEYDVGSKLAAPVRFIADVLSGVPSIVVGVLGYELLVAPAGAGAFKNIPYLSGITGNNGYAGALALAFIVIPLVARTTEEMLRLVPSSYREASIALGATKARTILRVVLPSVAGSVVTGVMLAIARIAGETAPLLFTALGSRFLETDPRRPFPSLTVQIYNYATGPYDQEKQLAWAGMLILVAIVFVLNLAIRYATRRSTAR